MNLERFFSLKYAQSEEELSDIEKFELQKKQEEEQAAEDAERFLYKKFEPGTHRGLSVVYKPLQQETGEWVPGEVSHVSFPVFKYPEIISDPSKFTSEPALTLIEAKPPKKEGPEKTHFVNFAEQLKQQEANSIKINGQEIPEEYKIDVHSPLDIFLASHKSGEEASWLSRAFRGARGDSTDYAYLHPSLLPSSFVLKSNTYQKIMRDNALNPIKNLDVFIGFMMLMSRYRKVGTKLSSFPELNDQEELSKFFYSFNQDYPMPEEIEQAKNNTSYKYNYEIISLLYNFMQDECEKIHKYDPIIRENSMNTTGSITEAISFAINNTLRKILSGYYNISKNIEENSYQIVGSLINYIKSSLIGDLKFYYNNQKYKKGILTGSDIVLEGETPGHSRGMEEMIADPSINIEEEVISKIMQATQDYEQSLEDAENPEISKELDPDVNIRNKQNIARKLVLSTIDLLGQKFGIVDILGQWTKDFKDFLTTNQIYMPDDVSKALPNLLQAIDFKYGILPENTLPCPKCGKTLMKDKEGKIIPAVVKGNKKQYVCQNCGFSQARMSDLSDYLSIPLLAFLQSKKEQYLKDTRFTVEQRVDMVEEIERLMSLNHLRVIVRGPSRSGRSVPGKEPSLIYKNGKMFLLHGRIRKPNLDTLLAFSELNELPLSAFLSGVGFPTGGYMVGYDRQSEDFRPPFGPRSLSMTPSVVTERNELIKIMMSQELLPLLAKNPKLKSQLGELKPVELTDLRQIGDINVRYLNKVITDVLQALEDIKNKTKLSEEKPDFNSYQELLNVARPELIKGTLYQLSKKYNDIIPSDNIQKSQQELSYLLERAASILDTIASLSDENINNLSIQQLLTEDPQSKTNPLYYTMNRYKQFEKGHNTEEEYSWENYINKQEEQKEKLETENQIIDNIMTFISINEQKIKEEFGMSLPQSHQDQQNIYKLKNFLISQGILEYAKGATEEMVEQALRRLGAISKQTINIYEQFRINGVVIDGETMLDLSEILSKKDLPDKISSILLQKPGNFGNFYSVLEGSPLVRLLFYISRNSLSYSITDFLQMLLISCSGMFGIGENYTVHPASFAVDPTTGEPIRFSSPTEDAAQKATGKGIAFDTAYRQIAGGEKRFPIQRPRFMNIPYLKDPYGIIDKAQKYKVFADQFSSEAIADNPKYQYYLNELSKNPEFQNMSPVQIINQLKEEITNCISTFYMDKGNELFKNDPITSMYAISSFFIPSDLLDVCQDIWARQIQQSSWKERKKGAVQNAFYQAASILFDIKDMTETEGWDEVIAKNIILKYKMADFDNPEDNELVDYLMDLLTRIANDIRINKGCASRALNVLKDRNNLKYLNTLYQPTRKTYEERTKLSKMLINVNNLIKLASRQADDDITNDLNELKYLVNRELYAKI